MEQTELFDWPDDGAAKDDSRDGRTRLSKVGEFLAAAELTAQGFDVSVAGEKLPYDLLADIGGRIIKVQVKTASYTASRDNYRFCTMRCSHKAEGKSRPYTTDDVDIFAFVAVDIRALVFFPASEVISGGIVDVSRCAFQQPDAALASLGRSVSRIERAAA